jgi:hypothetical protein
MSVNMKTQLTREFSAAKKGEFLLAKVLYAYGSLEESLSGPCGPAKRMHSKVGSPATDKAKVQVSLRQGA